LSLLLGQQPGLNVVSETADATQLLNQVEETHPDLVLLDWELPGSTPNGLLPTLRTMCPHLKVIALSGRPEARREAVAAGVDAFVSKSDPPERLLAALHAISDALNEDEQPNVES
jgi:DNA-binding NarL/FixJ family response regulator